MSSTLIILNDLQKIGKLYILFFLSHSVILIITFIYCFYHIYYIYYCTLIIKSIKSIHFYQNWKDKQIQFIIIIFNNLQKHKNQKIMQNQFNIQQFNNLAPKSYQAPSQHSLLSDSIQYLPFQLPQPLSILQQGLNNIPPYLRSPNLYKEIHSYNKKLIYTEFQLLCERITHTYDEAKCTLKQLNITQFQSRLNNLISQEFPNGVHIVNEMNKLINELKKSQSQLEYIRNILYMLGFIHATLYNLLIIKTNYQQFSMTNSNGFENRVPEKYRRIIEQQMSCLAKPVNANFFQNLIMNTLQGQNQQANINIKTQDQLQAQKSADALKKLLTSKYIEQNQTREGQKKPNTQGASNNIVQILIQNEVQTNRNSIGYPNLPNYTSDTSHNILLNLAQSISNQQLNNNMKKNYQQEKQLQFDQWFSDNYVKMGYYESYMMAHMASLIFLSPDKFDINLISYHPYLHQLNQQIKQEVSNLKSELLGYRLIFESNLKLLNQNSNPYSNQYQSPTQNPYSNQYQSPNQQMRDPNKNELKLEESFSNSSKKQKTIIDKAAGFFKNIRDTAKKQFNSDKNKVSPPDQKTMSRDQSKQIQNSIKNVQSIKQSQKQLISNNFPALEVKYYQLIQTLEKISEYLGMFYRDPPKVTPIIEQKAKQGVFKKLFSSSESKKIESQNLKNYHEVQSWMAIVMILYRQLAFKKSEGYHYSSLKRRTIIKICKRIFIQQRKKDKKNSQNKATSHSFRNWPLVLKFLENSRPQIMHDALSGANQKEVDRILQDFYSVFREKRMVGSSYGKLFEGLPPLKQTLPQIKLVCLSSGTNPTESLNKNKLTSQCKVVHILISGFLSQDTDKLEEWADMADLMPDSQVYALVWESTTIKGLVKFFLKSAVDIIGAMKMMDEIRRKYVDNPFNPAFQVAQITGRILAELVVRIFPNRFVNVCGYSLGSEVIKQFLQGIIYRKQTHILNNIYLMGGVSDADGFGQLISKSQTPLSVYNSYTMNDSVLKNLLSLCKPDIKPIGLNEIKKVGGHSVINVDCTKIISGHLAFRSNLGIMGQLLQVSTG